MAHTINEETPAQLDVGNIVRDDDYYRLRRDMEEFLYDEAEMLDTRNFEAWLKTLAEDLIYFMPMTFNVKYGQHAEHEKTRFEKDMSWFNEGKWTLTKRVEQIMTGVHWAEEPLSRVSRQVTNVQVTGVRVNDAGQQEVDVRSRFLIYQNRREYEEYFFVGKRMDVIRKEGDCWRLARREIDLGQNVLLAKNLTVLF